MSHTFKHQTQFDVKRKWREWRKNGCPDRLDISFYEHAVSMSSSREKKWIKKDLWRGFRHGWKQALHKGDYEKMPKKPESYDWIIW